MKLSHPNIENGIEFIENIHNVLVLKNKNMFCDFIEKLQSQCNGEEEGFLLLKGVNKLIISKKMIVYTDIFGVDCNERKILTKFYKMLDEVYSISGLMLDLNDINKRLIEIIEKLSELSDFDFVYRLDLSLIDYLKLYDVKVNNKGLSMFERICKVIELCAKLNVCDILVFVNLKLYLEEKELEEIYKFADYIKIHLFLIETIESNKIEREKLYIIDEDLCMIIK